LLVIPFLEARHVSVFELGGHQRSISWPQSARLQTRTWIFSPLISFVTMPTRVARLHVGQTSMTLEIGIGADFSITPPGVIWVPPMRLESRIGFGLTWRLTTFRFSTITRRSAGRAASTRPCLPRSLPVITCTKSPLWTLMLFQLLTSKAMSRTKQV